VTQPIQAWTEGRGTGGTPYFTFEGKVLQFASSVSEELIGPTQELIREIVDWRLAEYFSRQSNSAAQEYELRVSRSGDQPMLLLPDRSAQLGLPEGSTAIQVNNQELIANFVKVALNVVHAAGSDENVLPTILTSWFGSDAGKPGTKHRVVLRREDE